MPRRQAPIVPSVSLDAPSVNFHLWEPCNMACGFCFAGFKDVKSAVLPKGHLIRDDALRVVEGLCGFGFEKINFAGGEPTLCPWLPDLIGLAKTRGLTTSIVTNGSRLTEEWLDGVEGNLDWVALSIDSVDPDTLIRIGRAQRGKPMSADAYSRVAESLRRRGVRLKVNTVVNRCNHAEDMTAFIRSVMPQRWKLLQALRVEGQNDGEFESFAVSEREFDAYTERNRGVESSGIVVTPESNALMRGSYVMVDPAGRFFDNESGGHRYSRPILEVGVEEALREVFVDAARFRERGGLYDWRQ